MGKKHKNKNRGQQSAPLAAPAPAGSEGESMIDADALGGGETAPTEEVSNEEQTPVAGEGAGETSGESDGGSDGVDLSATVDAPDSSEADDDDTGGGSSGDTDPDTPAVDGSDTGDSGSGSETGAAATETVQAPKVEPAKATVATPKTVVIEPKQTKTVVKTVSHPQVITVQKKVDPPKVITTFASPGTRLAPKTIVVKDPSKVVRKTIDTSFIAPIDVKNHTTLGIKVITMFNEYEQMRRTLNLENRADRIKCARKLYDVMVLCCPRGSNAQYMHELIQIVFKKFVSGFGVLYTDRTLLGADYELPSPAEAIKFDAFYSAMYQLASAAKTGSRITFNTKSLGTLLNSYGATQAIREIREKIEARNAQR